MDNLQDKLGFKKKLELKALGLENQGNYLEAANLYESAGDFREARNLYEFSLTNFLEEFDFGEIGEIDYSISPLEIDEASLRKYVDTPFYLKLKGFDMLGKGRYFQAKEWNKFANDSEVAQRIKTDLTSFDNFSLFYSKINIATKN